MTQLVSELVGVSGLDIDGAYTGFISDPRTYLINQESFVVPDGYYCLVNSTQGYLQVAGTGVARPYVQFLTADGFYLDFPQAVVLSGNAADNCTVIWSIAYKSAFGDNVLQAAPLPLILWPPRTSATIRIDGLGITGHLVQPQYAITYYPWTGAAGQPPPGVQIIAPQAV